MLRALSVGNWINKFGENPSVSATLGATDDLIYHTGTAYLPADVVNGSNINITAQAGDTQAGTGARTIQIEGLDADGHFQTEVITLNGTSAVNPTKNWLRIYRAFVRTAGSNGGSTGTITIADGTGTFVVIPTFHNQTLHGVYTIPNDFKGGWLVAYKVSMAEKNTTNYTQCAIQTKSHDGVWQTKADFSVRAGSPAVYRYEGLGVRMSPLTDVKVTFYQASGDNLLVAGNFEIYLED